MRHELHDTGIGVQASERFPVGRKPVAQDQALGRQRSRDATHLSGILGVDILSVSPPFHFRHRAALGDICIAAPKRFCGYRIGLQHSTMETCDLTTGWATGKSEFPAYAVVNNVTRVAGRRNEIHSFASLTQNAYGDWHS
jgi:hypothetical protein